jgi:hypothetical protein
MSFSERLHIWSQHDGASHIAVMKCVSGSPRINLDARLVVDVKFRFPGLLHARLT